MKKANLSLLIASAALTLLCGCVPLQMAEAALKDSDLLDAVRNSAFSAPSENEVKVQSIAVSSSTSELVQRSYTAQGEVRRLDVEADNVSITVKSAEIDRAVVEYNEPADRTLYTISERNGELKIETRKDSRLNRLSDEYTLVVTLPAGEYESIEASADNGSVTLQGLSGWEIEGDADNGSVILQNLSAREVSADVNNGSISAQEITADKLSMDADNGQIKLAGSSVLLLEAEADNGEILFDKASATVLECEVNNGKISGTLAGSASDYSVRSSVKLGSSNLTSTQRTGAARSLAFEVEIGDIDIQFAG